MFDVLVYLYENFGALSAWPDSAQLTRKLTAAGFEDDEINDALTWLQGLARVTQASNVVREAGANTFRVYAAFEMQSLGASALNFLAFLEGAGQLSSAQREIVIERALALRETPVPLFKLKVIVLIVLWSQQADIDILLLEELLDDDDERLLN